MLGVFKNKELHVFIKKTEDPGPTRGGGGRKTLKLNLIFGAASGIVLTRRRTSRTTRTGSKRRSTCCCGVRLSRQRSEASEEVESGGDQNYFSCLELVLKVLSNLFSEVFDFFFFSSHVGGCILYFIVGLNKVSL